MFSLTDTATTEIYTHLHTLYLPDALPSYVPTSHGSFRFLAYKDRVTGTDHLAVVSGDLTDDAPLVRVHSECLTGEAFGSLKCECGPQLEAALDAIDRKSTRLNSSH